LTADDKKSAIAAALILLFVAFGLMAMPRLVIGLAEAVSPYAGVALALAFILAPFLILWVRSRVQHNKAK
jgi:ABC-type sulfate transport system permease component